MTVGVVLREQAGFLWVFSFFLFLHQPIVKRNRITGGNGEVVPDVFEPCPILCF